MNITDVIEKAGVLVEALPYIQRFNKARVLVKFGGSAMEDPDVTRRVLKDIAFMAAAGMRPIIVHGGGKAISAELKRQNIPTRFVNGLRYTCPRTIEVVDQGLQGQPLLLEPFGAGNKNRQIGFHVVWLFVYSLPERM